MPTKYARPAITAIVFLGMVLAAAGVAVTAAGSTNRAPTSAEATDPANLTVVPKNREFPLKMRMTMHPCAVSTCIDI